jgi:hypothetical protein
MKKRSVCCRTFSHRKAARLGRRISERRSRDHHPSREGPPCEESEPHGWRAPLLLLLLLLLSATKRSAKMTGSSQQRQEQPCPPVGQSEEPPRRAHQRQHSWPFLRIDAHSRLLRRRRRRMRDVAHVVDAAQLAFLRVVVSRRHRETLPCHLGAPPLLTIQEWKGVVTAQFDCMQQTRNAHTQPRITWLVRAPRRGRGRGRGGPRGRRGQEGLAFLNVRQGGCLTKANVGDDACLTIRLYDNPARSCLGVAMSVGH